MQIAYLLRRIMLSSLAAHIISYSARFLEEKMYWTLNLCFDFLYKFFATCIFLSIILRDRRSSCKVAAILVGFKET
jgi:hypothetical protein